MDPDTTTSSTETPSTAASACGPGRGLLQGALLVLPLAILAGTGWAHRWTSDDGFIYFRSVRQITSGNGPVFNAGERVESFTSPLWLAVLSIGDLLTPVRLEWLAVVLGLALSVAGVGFAMAGSRQLIRVHEPSALLVPFGALLFVVLIPAWIFATSGLETGLVFAWLGATLWILATWARGDRRLRLPEACLLGLGWIVRPEMVLFSACFAVLVVVTQWRGDNWRQRVELVGVMIALPLAYQLFRMGYYGSLVSNTAIAKESSRVRWDRGWQYLRDFTDPYWLWVPAIVVAIGGYVPLVLGLYQARRMRALGVVGAFVAASVGATLYVTIVGGDYFHARLLMPALFGFCAPVALVPTARQYAAAVVLVPWAIAAAFFLRPTQLDAPSAISSHLIFLQRQDGNVTNDDYDTHSPAEASWYTGPGLYEENDSFRVSYHRVDVPLADDVDPPVLAAGAVGKIGLAIGPDFRLLDELGLGDAMTAHLITNPGFPLPHATAHEKPLPAPWLAARLTPPGTALDGSEFEQGGNPLIPPTKGAAFEEKVAWARAALRCPEIRQLMQSVDAPLTVGRFFDNIAHAFDNTRVRIPPDPEAAYRKFCGSGVPADVRALASPARAP